MAAQQTDAPPPDWAPADGQTGQPVQVVQVVQVQPATSNTVMVAPGPDNGQTSTTAQTGEFGTSEYGERLSYAEPKYQDLFFFVCFYVHVVFIIVLIPFFWSQYDPDAITTSTTTPSPFVIVTTSTTPSPTITSSESDGTMDALAAILSLLAAVFSGCGFGVLWLQCMKKFAESIIKIMIFVAIAMWAILAILGFALEAIPMAIFAIIFLLVTCLYAWCVWSRIPFSAACLAIASEIAQLYPGTIYTSFAAVFAQFIWMFVWIFAVMGYSLTTPAEDQNNFVSFLFLISLYWGVNVWKNVSHTTSCGVAATWYFNPGQLVNPSRAAFKRAMTTSFGSISLGSLIVAILQALRAMARSNRNGLGACLLACIERLIRYFNKYAFAQCAIYGTNFVDSAKKTWELFLSQGIMAIVNDDLSGMALACGAVLGAVVAALAALGVSLALTAGKNLLIVIVCTICGFFLGYYACAIMMMVIASGVICIFVCYAEDPAAIATNRPEAFNKLAGRSEGMAQIATNRGLVVTQQPPQ